MAQAGRAVGPGNKGARGARRLCCQKELRHTRDRVAAGLPRETQTAGCKGRSLAKTAPLTPSLPGSRCVCISQARGDLKLISA